MDRITGTGVVDIGDGKRGFQDQVLSTGAGNQEGTVVTAEWLNSVQEEILNVITKAGLLPDAGDPTQLAQALALFGQHHGGVNFGAPGNHTFIAPVTCWYWVECYGGGGGGAYFSPNNDGEGGGGGGYAAKWVLLAQGTEVTVSVAGGGVTNVSGSGAGAAGGTSAFGAHCSATGGKGGVPGGDGGDGGSGGGGDINLAGQAGGDGLTGVQPFGYGGDCAGPYGGKGALRANGATWPGGGGSIATGGSGLEWKADGADGGVVIRY